MLRAQACTGGHALLGAQWRRAGAACAPVDGLRFMPTDASAPRCPPAPAKKSCCPFALVSSAPFEPTPLCKEGSGARGHVSTSRVISVIPAHLKAGLRESSCTFSMRCTDVSTFAMSYKRRKRVLADADSSAVLAAPSTAGGASPHPAAAAACSASSGKRSSARAACSSETMGDEPVDAA